MESHVKLLGVLYIIFGVFGLFVALIVLAIFGGVAGLVRTTAGEGPGAAIGVPLLGVVGGLLFLMLAVVSSPCVIAGVGLLKRREWARVLTIVLCVLNVFNIPLGTVLGIYGLWVLFHQQTVPLFQATHTSG